MTSIKLVRLVGLFGICCTVSSFATWMIATRSAATSLYAKLLDGTGGCFAVCTGSVSANFQTVITAGELQATIESAQGSDYYLWESSSCTNDVKFL